MSHPARAGGETRRGRCEMTGFTAVPRWTLKPVPGVGEHEARIPDELVAALRRLANEVAVPLSSVLLAAHAKVLGALSGEREVCTGYTRELGPPLPLRIRLDPVRGARCCWTRLEPRRSLWRTGVFQSTTSDAR